MTPDPTLTDEELAEWMSQVAFFHRLGHVFVKRHRRMPYLTTMVLDVVPRLIATLRASRAEVERLRVCAEWARRTIDDEWPDGPTGDTENWRRFVRVADRGEGPPPTLT